MSPTEWLEIIQTIGTPSIVAFASFWFIRYQFDQASKERERYINLDKESDNRLLELAEHSNNAINSISKSLDANTRSLDLLTQTLKERTLK